MWLDALFMVIHILQWNARSLLANGQELKRYIYDLEVVPDVICVQETWLRPQIDFRIPGFSVVRHDRDDKHSGGGCATFIKDGLAYREITSPKEIECVVVELCSSRKERNLKIINFYNPCRNLTCDMFKEIAGIVY